MQVRGHLHAPAALSSPKERAPGTHQIGWVASRAYLDTAVGRKKIPAPAGNRIPVSSAYPSHYTDSELPRLLHYDERITSHISAE